MNLNWYHSTRFIPPGSKIGIFILSFSLVDVIQMTVKWFPLFYYFIFGMFYVILIYTLHSFYFLLSLLYNVISGRFEQEPRQYKNSKYTTSIIFLHSEVQTARDQTYLLLENLWTFSRASFCTHCSNSISVTFFTVSHLFITQHRLSLVKYVKQSAKIEGEDGHNLHQLF